MYSMKRIALLIIAFLSFSIGVSAQSKTRVAYHGKGFTIKGTKGFKLKVANTYTLDGVAFAPTFDASQATLDGQPFEIKPNIAFTNLQTNLSGDFSKRWGFEFHINYAQNRINLLNMLLDYRFSDNFKLRMGQMKVPGPMSQNYGTGTAMSVATPMGLSMASDRRFGIGLFYTTGRLYSAIGAYSFNLNDYVVSPLPKRPEVGVAGRFTYNVLNNRHQKLLLGTNIYWMRMQNGLSSKAGEIGVETVASTARFIRYYHFNTSSQLNYGLELAYQNRNFLLTAEGLGTNFFRSSDLATPQYAGWNVRASYTVLGNPRRYNAAMGDFSGSPYDGKQALELGLRSSGIYCNNHEGVKALAGYSVGAFANYWTTTHLCFSLHANYIDHHKDFTSNYEVKDPTSFKGLDFMVFQGRVTILF